MTAQAWRRVKLGDHVDLITGFPFRSAQYTSNHVDIKLLRGDNIAQGCLRWDGVKRWPHLEAGDYKQYFLNANDIVLAMDRPWIEVGLKWSVVRAHDLPALLVQRVARVRGKGDLHSEFLRYIISSSDYSDYIKSIITGANVPHISGPDIKKYEFVLPPLSAQRRIASILTAYDDLIDNNTRRIKILEEQKTLLFSHYENANARHLRVRSLGEISDASGGTIRTGPFGSQLHESDYTPDGIPVVMPKNIIKGRIDTADIARVPIEIAERLSQHALQPGDIVYGRRGDIGRRAHISKRQAGWLCGTGCLRISVGQRILHSRYLYEYLGKPEVVTMIANRAIGATMPNLNTSILRDIPIALPTYEQQRAFAELVEPQDELVEVLTEKNHILRQTRDLLLPKLISGEIDVSSFPDPTP